MDCRPVHPDGDVLQARQQQGIIADQMMAMAQQRALAALRVVIHGSGVSVVDEHHEAALQTGEPRGQRRWQVRTAFGDIRSGPWFWAVALQGFEVGLQSDIRCSAAPGKGHARHHHLAKTIAQLGDPLGWQGIQHLVAQQDALPGNRGGFGMPADAFLEPGGFVLEALLAQGAQHGAWFHDVIVFG